MPDHTATRPPGPDLDAILAAMLKLGSQIRAQYSSPAIEHYCRVADRLGRLAYSDEVLATAGFCHGAWLLAEPDALGEIVGAEVCSVLHNWARLDRLRPEDLPAAVGDDPRAAFLYVYDRLDQIDPGDTLVAPSELELSRWSPVSLTGEAETGVFLAKAATTARIAELLGLRDHRNAIEDIALAVTDRALMDRTIDFIEKSSQIGGHPQLYAAAIDALIEPMVGASEPRLRCDPAAWRWRHPAAVARTLAASTSTGPGEPPAMVAACGSALIVCDSDEMAYRIVGRLHAHATDYDPSRFFDSVGRETKNGYRALHTAVSVVALGHRECVQVHIQPRSRPRPRPSPSELLEQGLRASPRRRADHIRVSTPRGEIHELPTGAHVLAFAAALHSDLAARAIGAIINSRDRVMNVLHRLNDGDRVELILDKKPCLPPEQWEDGLSSTLKRRVHNGLRRGFATHLRTQGVSWVRKRVTVNGISAEDSILLALLEWAVLNMPLRKAPRELADTARRDWILQQLGIVEGFERGERLPMPSLIAHDEIKSIEANLEKVLAQLQVERGPTVPEDEALRRRTRAIVFCSQCSAGDAPPYAAERRKDGTLLVHRLHAKCAQGAPAFALVDPRFATLNQYFAVETTNRIGIAEEILGVFRSHDVDLTDMSGRKLGPGWAIFRVGIGPTGPTTISAIEAQLQTIAGVQRVRGPGQGPLPILEDWLPARAEYMRQMDPPGRPYHVGGEIADDRYFYGRAVELGALESAYHDAVAGPGGTMVLVHGPLKTGKSSLVAHFMRRLRAKGTDVVALRHVADEEIWTSVEQRLGQLLVEQIHDHARDQNLSPPPTMTGNLAAMLRTLRRWNNAPRIVLVIDEAVRMLQYMAATAGRPDTDEAIRAMRGFQTALANLPQVMVVLIGPKAPTLHLPGPLRQFVNAARSIPLSPFTLKDTRALIEAQNLQNIFQISATRHVIQRAYEDTAGDPFWISQLAARMWERANLEHDVRFDLPQFAEARRYIAHADHIFHDRVEPQPGELLGVDRLWRIATTVAELCDGANGTTRACISEQMLREELATGGLALTADELAVALDDLTARGAVMLSGGSPPEGRTVCIAAPLLAENLRTARRRPLQGA